MGWIEQMRARCLWVVALAALAFPAWAQEIPTAVIRGTVQGQTTEGTQALEGATVTLLGPAGREVSTDANGGFEFDQLFSGTYTVRVMAPGFNTQSEEVPLPEAGIVVLDFLLEPAEPGLPADINGDGVVNAVDVQLVINAALGIDISGSAP